LDKENTLPKKYICASGHNLHGSPRTRKRDIRRHTHGKLTAWLFSRATLVAAECSLPSRPQGKCSRGALCAVAATVAEAKGQIEFGSCNDALNRFTLGMAWGPTAWTARPVGADGKAHELHQRMQRRPQPHLLTLGMAWGPPGRPGALSRRGRRGSTRTTPARGTWTRARPPRPGQGESPS